MFWLHSKSHLVIGEAETLRRNTNKRTKFGQEMVCKVADVYTLYTFFFSFTTQLNQGLIIEMEWS